MQSRTHLIFESSAFQPFPGEDDETNPGIYGRALSEWLAERLRSLGHEIRRVVPEDFGRLIELAHPDCKLYVAVSSTDHTANEWRVFAFVEFGFLAKLKGSLGGGEAVAKVMTDLERVLAQHSEVHSLREEPA